MNKLMLLTVIVLILCVNIPVIAEQGKGTEKVCQNEEACCLGTLNLTMGSCRIYNLSFVPGEKEITLYVEKNASSTGTDAYVIFNITVKPGGTIPTILWWKLERPIKTGDSGFGAEFFFPGYPSVKPFFTRIIKGYVSFGLSIEDNNRTIVQTLKAGALFGGRITEDGYTVHLIRVED